MKSKEKLEYGLLVNTFTIMRDFFFNFPDKPARSKLVLPWADSPERANPGCLGDKNKPPEPRFTHLGDGNDVDDTGSCELFCQMIWQ
jgi:hypothetical protein